MSQHEPHCKRHHRRDHSSGSRGESRIPTERHNSQLVNKIASIDIWATERLYEKWRQQAAGEKVEEHNSPSKNTERQTPYNRNATQSTCQRHGGSVAERYFTASLAKPTNANLGTILTIGDPSVARIQAQHSTCHRQHRSESRPDESRRRPERWYFLQNKTQRKRQSLSSETVPPIHCQCHQKCQHQRTDDSEESSDADTPNSWTPIWGSSALNVMRVGSNNENFANQLCAEEKLPNNRQRQQRLQSRPGKQGRSREKQPADTVEAIITINPQERVGSRKRPKNLNGRGAQKTKARPENSREENLASGKPTVVCCLSSNSLKQKTSGSENHSQLSNQRARKRQIQNSVDQNTCTIVRDISCQRTETQSSTRVRYIESDEGGTGDREVCDYGIARICKTEKCLVEKVNALPKPVVWLMTEQLTPDVHPSSANEGSTVRLSEIVDNTILSSATFVTNAAARKAKGCARQARLDKENSRHNILRDFMDCNNSVDGKSLHMLSTISNENEAEAHTSGSLCPALVSKVKLSRCLSIARCSFPNIRTQSNTSMTRGTIEMEFGYVDGSTLMEHRVGESIIVEPKIGSVTRYVHEAVQRARKLVATRGFAGLVARRSSDMDSSTTVTAGTDTVRDDNADEERLMCTDSEEIDLCELDELDSEESDTRKGKTRLRQPGKIREGRNGVRQGGDQGRDDSSLSQQACVSKKLLPMTECPTTRHRIECYRTRSGRIKCYMTARHPVKCRVECGRIVCKATVNPEPSELPNLCDTEWQCQ